MADALDSGSSVSNDVWVQVPSFAPDVNPDEHGVCQGFVIFQYTLILCQNCVTTTLLRQLYRIMSYYDKQKRAASATQFFYL